MDVVIVHHSGSKRALRTACDDHVAALIDELVDDAVEYLAEGERSGLVRPSERPRQRAVVLVLWSLGLLTLHEHVRRHLDADLVGDAGGLDNYLLPAAEVLDHGVLADGVYEQMREAFGAVEVGDE